MTPRKILASSALPRYVLLSATALFIAAFAGLMIRKTVPYYSFEPGISFLGTKSVETNQNSWFRLAFYTHISSSVVMLVVGLAQWLPAVAKLGTRTHRTFGKAYVFGILAVAAPSGLVLARFANGGLVAQVAFSLQAGVWWVATLLAYQNARRRRWPCHVTWMLRSYAITLAALSLRGESYLFYYCLHTKPIETYLTVAWLSWVGNLLVMEVLIQAGLRRFFLRSHFAHLKRHG